MASYTRQSSFSDGDTISASLFNNEYNQLVTAFSYSSSGTTGHRHDGTAAEGGNIHTIGDQDFLNKIVVDSSNNRWGVYVQVSGATVEQIRFQDGSIVPVTSNDIDLGTSSLQFKDLHIDGTASIDSLTLTSGSTVTVILDEDDLSTNSATALATQQSIKAYVDSQVTGQALTFSGDSGGSLSIDLDSEALTITGGTGIDTTGSTNDMSIAIDSTVATLTGSQTLTNKTLTSPDINGGTIDGATIGGSSAGNITYANLSDGTITITAFADEDDMSSNSATLVPTQQSVKAYVDSKVTAEDLDFQADSGGALSIDLDSETMTFTGGTGIDTSGSGNAVTFAIDSTVTTLAGTQTLTNKTLTTPVITSISNSGTVTLSSGNTTLVGTATSDVLTNKTISGSSNTLSNIGNSSLSNSSVSFGGISVALGSSDATPAFDLSDATGYTGDSSLVTTGTISSGVWQGTAVADTYVANDLTISGGTVNNTVIGGSSPAAADFTTVDTTGNATIGGNLAVTGNLTINGTTSTVNSTTVTIDDPIFTLGGDTTPSTDDNKDRGIEFKWHNGTGAKLGFFGYDDSASVFTFIPDASNTSEVFSGSAGNVAFGAISGTSFASTGNMTFGDDDKAIFGAGSDLQIYHDGSNSYVNDNGTGDLVLKTNGAGVQMWGGGDVMLNAVKDGAVSLYHDNAAKLATTATGIQVTGDISNTSGDLTIDVAGNIRLDADDNGEIRYLDGGTQYAAIKKDGNNALFQSIVADGDFIIQGIDGASFVSALTLDMSTGGTAYFADDVRLTDNHALRLGTDADIVFYHDNSNGYLENGTGLLTLDVAGDIRLDAGGGNIQLQKGGTEFGRFFEAGTNDFYIYNPNSDKDIIVYGNDAGTAFEAVRFDMSASGAATFAGEVLIPEKLSHVGDTDTHFKFAGANDIRIVAGNVEHAAFDGTIVFNQGGSSAMDFRVESDTNENMLFVDAGNNRVGIGTGSPSYELVISKDGSSGIEFGPEGVNSTTSFIQFYNRSTAAYDSARIYAKELELFLEAAQVVALDINTTEAVINQSGTDLDFRVESDGNANMLFVDASADRFFLGGSTQDAGGTFSFDSGSAQIRHVHPAGTSKDNLMFAITGANNGFQTTIDGSNLITYKFHTGGNVEAATFGTSESVFNQPGADRDFRVESSIESNAFTVDGETGQVGVGSRSGFKFGHGSLQGNAGSSGSGYPVIGYNIKFTGTAADYGTMVADTSWRLDIGTNNRMQVHSRSSTAAVASGATYTAGPYVALNGTSWTSSSDARLKKNVNTITGAIDKVKAMRPVNYTWIHAGEDAPNQIGFIAQEMALIVPEVVDIPEDDEVHQGIQYEKLVPVLTAALQEALTKIETLEARIAALES